MLFIKKINKKIEIEEIKKEVAIYEKDTIYVGGSLIEGEINSLSSGMGNIYSDIDFFIIREHESFLKTNCIYDNKFKKTLFVNSLKYDVEIYDSLFIDLLINEINNINFDIATRINNTIKLDISLSDINSFLCRLYNSICLYNENYYNKLKNSINQKKFLELYSSYFLNIIDNKIVDVIGNLSEKQYDVALYCMRSIFLDFSKYFIMKNNEYIDRDKWVFLKLFNIIKHDCHHEIKNCYNKLFCSVVDENKEKVILESLDFIKNKIEDFSLEEINI